MSAIDVLLSRLDGVRGSSPKFMAKCPGHDDKSPSLSIRACDDGRVLIHCFAGCSPADVLAAIGMSLKDLYPDGPVGEISPHRHRSPENVLYRPAYIAMEDEIFKLRARLSAK